MSNDPDPIREMEVKTIENLDQIVLKYSAGGAAFSIAFIKSIVGVGDYDCGYFLYASWISWTVAISSVFVSYFLGHLSARKIQEGKRKQAIRLDRGTGWLNYVSFVAFLSGLISLIVFVIYNFEEPVNVKGTE